MGGVHLSWISGIGDGNPSASKIGRARGLIGGNSQRKSTTTATTVAAFATPMARQVSVGLTDPVSRAPTVRAIREDP